MTERQALVERMAAWIGGFVALTEDQALVCALWAIHTWYWERFRVTPYLEIFASTKRSGKTTLMDCIGLLSRKMYTLASVRVLTVCKLIESEDSKLTLGFDEAERLCGNSIAVGDTRSMLALGFRQGAEHKVSVGTEFKSFRVACPRMFALIGNLTPVLRDRSISLYLARKTPTRSLNGEYATAEAEASGLIDDLVRHFGTAEGMTTVRPDWLTEREIDLWTPIVSLATFAGFDKRTMARLVAVSTDMAELKLAPPLQYHSQASEEDAQDKSYAERVLHDLATVLHEGESAVWTSVALHRLKALPSAPWRVYKGVGLDDRQLGGLLARFGLESTVVWHRVSAGKDGRKQAKGYKSADVRRALKAVGQD